MKAGSKSLFIIFLSIILSREIAGASFIRNKVVTSDTAFEGEINVEGVITVERNTVLTVRPGTIMKFISLGGKLIVRGTLEADGTEDKKINFILLDVNNTSDKWDGIVFYGERNKKKVSRLSNCVISSAVNGMECMENAAVMVESCVFSENNLGVRLSMGSSITIKHSTFSGNTGGGIYSEQSVVNISNSRFLNNADYAVNYVTGQGSIIDGNFIEGHQNGLIFSFMNTEGIIRNNIIQGNKYGILTDRLAEIVISNNTIQNNDYGIYIQQDAVPRIFLNEITKNRIGIFITESYNLRMLSINNNNIYDNKEYEAGLEKSSAEYARKSIKKIADGGRSADLPPYFMGYIMSGLSPLEYIDVKRNFWGEALTDEMKGKGDFSNISKILDFYDNPGADEKENYFLYSEWLPAPVEGAGAKKGSSNDTLYVTDTAYPADSTSQKQFKKRYKYYDIQKNKK